MNNDVPLSGQRHIVYSAHAGWRAFPTETYIVFAPKLCVHGFWLRNPSRPLLPVHSPRGNLGYSRTLRYTLDERLLGLDQALHSFTGKIRQRNGC